MSLEKRFRKSTSLKYFKKPQKPRDLKKYFPWNFRVNLIALLFLYCRRLKKKTDWQA